MCVFLPFYLGIGITIAVLSICGCVYSCINEAQKKEDQQLDRMSNGQLMDLMLGVQNHK